MRHRSVTALAAGVLLGTLSLAPTVGAVVGGAGPASADTPPAPAEWGTVTGVSGTLAKGCNAYTYTYDLHPPAGLWSFEVVITGPDGLNVAHSDLLYGADDLSGTRTYQVCNATTPPGTFSISGKLSVDNGPAQPGANGYVEGMIGPSTYTLVKPPKAPEAHHKHRHKKHRHHHRPR